MDMAATLDRCNSDVIYVTVTMALMQGGFPTPHDKRSLGSLKRRGNVKYAYLTRIVKHLHKVVK